MLCEPMVSERALPRVDVLLATYNGAAWLRPQLDSLLQQVGVDFHIYIRDDGSSDATPALLAEYATRHPDSISLVHKEEADKSRGGTANFLKLLARHSDAEYFAFCDQDDVWPVDRLQVAVAALSALHGPRLYCGAVTYVDADLNVLGNSSHAVMPGLHNALVENIAQGCTMVFDAGLRRLVAERIPTRAAIHDWWMYLVATAFGHVIYDPVPRLLYRQHGANEVGGNFSLWQKLRKNFRRYMTGRGWPMAVQAEHLLALYPDKLNVQQQATLRAFVAGKCSLLVRLRLVFSPHIRRQSLFETLALKFLLLINAY